jgi:hypothetical protein
MSKNALFIHIAILEKWDEILLRYLDCIYSSGLIDNLKYIYLCFIGHDNIPIDIDRIARFNSNKNITILKVSNDLKDYELPTLSFLYDFCSSNKDFNVIYLHTKGVGKVLNQCIQDQVQYMLYFNITLWKTCLTRLLDYDTCGVDLRENPTLHYSGNFWWARSTYINTLPQPVNFNNLTKYPNPLNSLRHNQEFWICYDKKGRHLSLWDCGINCYERHLHLYPRDKYVLIDK